MAISNMRYDIILWYHLTISDDIIISNMWYHMSHSRTDWVLAPNFICDITKSIYW